MSGLSIVDRLRDKPSLHEIAAMPYSETVKAMRQFYDPLWGFPHGDGSTQKYTVEVEYTYTCTDYETVEVEAENEEEAIELAGDEAYRICRGLGNDFEVARSVVKSIAPGEAVQ